MAAGREVRRGGRVAGPVLARLGHAFRLVGRAIMPAAAFQPDLRETLIEYPVTALSQRYRLRERDRSYGPVCIRAYAALSAWLQEGN